MRLLRVSNNTFSFEEFGNQESTPPYAILSHRWESEEVDYEDIIGNPMDYRKKAGYGKLRFLADQAKKDGLQYFWIDTCCINKSSSSELSEAINSMFRWYRNASTCYAYLSDVSTRKRKRCDVTPSWDREFQNSAWFTRGWTLQELLAPSQVEFFDRSGTFLGTRTGLKDTISSLTHIPAEVLEGRCFKNYNIAQRMSWAASRKATREEDIAYCLLGIFDVHMPLLYGEGAANAFLRLQEKIIKKTDDHSIFAWRAEKRYATHGLLAPSPAVFADSYNIVPIPSPGTSTPFALTQLGLQIRLDLNRHENGLHAAFLNCMDQKTKARIGVHLIPLGDNCFLRTRLDQFVTARHRRPLKGFVPLGKRTVYLQQQSLQPLRGLRAADLRRYRTESSTLHLY